MFAVELSFKDGVSESQTVFVSRPRLLIGGNSFAHVVVQDLKDYPYQLSVSRGVGRSFRCEAKSQQPDAGGEPPKVNGEYHRSAQLDFGPVSLFISALDHALQIKPNEPPDRAGARIVRECASGGTPDFPAVVLAGDQPVIVSFSPQRPVFLGRGRECEVRCDVSDVSSRHARIGMDGDGFWIEDLGSTNGTFVSGAQIAGRASVEDLAPVVLARDVLLYVVRDESQLREVVKRGTDEVSEKPDHTYPVLVSLSEVARPARFHCRENSTIQIGRDPSSDLRLGAPHVSRKHCQLEYRDDEGFILTDFSMNGVAYDGGVLSQGESVTLGSRASVFNFGGGVTVAICFSKDDEDQFNLTNGDPYTFLSDEERPSNEFALQRSKRSGAAGKKTFWNTGVIGMLRRMPLKRRLLAMISVFFVLLSVLVLLRLMLPILLGE